jgi:hypothetical protein
MTTIQDLAEFRSPRFAPVLPEECQVNPGRYGVELALWLCTRLYEKHRIATSYPKPEDWGWLLRYSTGAGYEFAIHCGNIDGSNDRWLLSIRRFGRKLFGRDKPSFALASELIGALRSLLEGEESVTELSWLCDDERGNVARRKPHP